jgi:glycosyltransferase involved in cell wall biosynthesis
LSEDRTRLRVLLLQHAIYPYRRPLFDALNTEIDLTVVFCMHAKSFRNWDTSSMLDNPPFRAKVLPHVRLGRLVFNKGLLREVARGRYDAIVLGVIDLITLPQIAGLLLVARSKGIPIVVCEEFFITDWYLRTRPIVGRIAIATRRFVYQRATAFAVWNPKARDFLVASGIDGARIFSGPTFYPPPDRMRPNRPVEPRTIVTISYFLPRKGLDVLIRAFRRLTDDVRLVIAGSGELDSQLRAEASGDPRIRFAGYLDPGQKEELLVGAYAFVLPTLWDPWGTVVNEALYQGVPVVVTDATGLAGSIGDAGIVVPAGDEVALTATLNALLTDRGRRAELAARTQEVVGRWTVDAQLRPLVDAIQVAVGASSVSRKGAAGLLSRLAR